MQTEKNKVFFKYSEDKTEAIAINLETKEEVARREVKLRHGDKPNKIVARKYVFKKLMDHIRKEHLLANTEVGFLWKQFGSTCKQPSEKLVY